MSRLLSCDSAKRNVAFINHDNTGHRATFDTQTTNISQTILWTAFFWTWSQYFLSYLVEVEAKLIAKGEKNRYYDS